MVLGCGMISDHVSLLVLQMDACNIILALMADFLLSITRLKEPHKILICVTKITEFASDKRKDIVASFT